MKNGEYKEFKDEKVEQSMDAGQRCASAYGNLCKILGATFLICGIGLLGVNVVDGWENETKLNEIQNETADYLAKFDAKGETIEDKIAYVTDFGTDEQKEIVESLSEEQKEAQEAYDRNSENQGFGMFFGSIGGVAYFLSQSGKYREDENETEENETTM